ncbi:hypothetical protein ACFW1M_11740 [Streptomyces inhibens]|uniref:hypothetical protein n=1 Tax=Streptomyces inhibens TaxID=2293571 RepID=UPI00369D5CD8
MTVTPHDPPPAPPDPPPTPPDPPPTLAGVMGNLRIYAEVASTLCAMVAILISVITWRSQQDFNDRQDDFNNRQVDFNKKQQQLALNNEERQEEEYSLRVSIWNDVEDFTIKNNGYTLPGYRTFLVVQNRSQAPLNQVVVIWPAMPGGLKKKAATLGFIPPCSSVRMSEEYFSAAYNIDLGEEFNKAEPPVLAFTDANRNSWARSASGDLKKISSAAFKPYKDDLLPIFQIPAGKEKTVKMSEMPNCGS